MSWIDKYLENLSIKTLYFALLITSGIIIIYHFYTFVYSSLIDWIVFFFYAASFAVFYLGIISQNLKINIIAINLSLIFSFIFIIELIFLFGVASNPSIKATRMFGYEGINQKLKRILGYEDINEKVIKLSQNPWYKFKENTLIISQGARGRDFVYEWKTDSRGFKNHENLNKADFLALGDSFTEGMGVATEDAWPSVVSQRSNIKIYNAGVQGYAASQFYGALRYLNSKIEFDGIVIGHLPGIYERERNFRGIVTNAIGGIESIREASVDSTKEASKPHFEQLVLPQIVKGVVEYLKSKKSIPSKVTGLIVEPIPSKSIDPTLVLSEWSQMYLKEIPKQITTRQMLIDSPDWQSLIGSYRNIIEFAVLRNKKIILISFPHRHEVYFDPKVLGIQTLMDSQYYTELNLIKESFNNKDISIIDTYPALRAFYLSASSNASLPYHAQDGHLSKLGNEIIANEVLKILNH